MPHSIPADNNTLPRTADLTCPDHPILAAGICLSANEVPRIAQMYGLDTSTKVNVMAVGHAVNMGSRAVGLIKSASKVAT